MPNSCKYTFKKGVHKGKQCIEGTYLSSEYCKKHTVKNSGKKNNIEAIKQVFDNRVTNPDDGLKHKIMALETSLENKSVMLKHYNNMKRVDANSTEYYKNQAFVDLALSYPWNKVYDINYFLKNTDVKTFLYYIKSSFDKEIYGMEHVKNEIINIVCKLITNPLSTRNNIALCGPAGVGKSKFIQVLSNVLGIPLKVISLGGVKDSSFFLGHSYVYVESGPGKILQNIIDSHVGNPIIYFDELDKVSDNGHSQDIYAFLSYLTDPTQNHQFTDHYFYGMKFDLSKVFYVFTFNDINKIDRILLDRLNVVNISKPSLEETYMILKNHCIPDIIKNIGIVKKIAITHDQIKRVVQEFGGKSQYEHESQVSSGIREYYRVLEKILLEVNKDILLEKFESNVDTIHIDDDIFSEYVKNLKKQSNISDGENLLHMYI